MRRALPILVALPLLAGFGLAEGLWTNRWSRSQALELAVTRLRQVPLEVDEWAGTDQELDARQVARAEIEGYVMRQYVNRSSGAQVSILLVCGRPGPTCVHTPDVCYQGAGYVLEKPETLYDVKAKGQSAKASFKLGQFQKPGPVPEPLRIFWSWSANGEWEAPKNPRLHFARQSALYKLYVIQASQSATEDVADDPSVEFLDRFLPALRTCLFEAP